MKHLVKDGRAIRAFIWQCEGNTFYAYGKPSDVSYIRFNANSIEHAFKLIKEFTGIVGLKLIRKKCLKV